MFSLPTSFEFKFTYLARTMLYVRPGKQETPWKTMCKLTVGLEVCTSEARCHKKDQFSYDRGRKLALATALKEHKWLTKDARRQIWRVYFEARSKKFPG